MNLTTHAVTRLLHQAEIPGATHAAGDEWVRVLLRDDADMPRALGILQASGYVATASDLLPAAINVTGMRVGWQAVETLQTGDEIRWQSRVHSPRWRIQISQVTKTATRVVVEGLGWLEAHPDFVDYRVVRFVPNSPAWVTRRAEMPVRP